ncbi:MAG TPA: CBS domain-containing protein [Myxococcota bacterium]|nr:CBS domain-containing protein [Myxococcota bacterium]
MAHDDRDDDCEDLIDENYFETRRPSERTFDAALLREPVAVLPVRRAATVSPYTTVTEAMRRMKSEHHSCVVITDDGTAQSKLTGIFTERDVLFRVVDRGRNPAAMPIDEVMTPDPETLSVRSTVAAALNMMSVGGYRHVPVVDDEHRPVFVVRVRDVVEFIVEAFPREILNLPVDHHAVVQRQRAREGA